MTVTGVISAVLLVAGLVVVVASCVGMAVLDDPLDRMHLTTPAAMLGSAGICAAVVVRVGLSASGLAAIGVAERGGRMSDAVIAVALVWVAVAGTAVVLTRDPLRQAFTAGFFGLALAFLYFSLQAGDVALSQIVVGAIALPLIVLLSLAKVRKDRE
jgi:energy-converting hydrogenase B subunit D